jgi:hypothetical protein
MGHALTGAVVVLGTLGGGFLSLWLGHRLGVRVRAAEGRDAELRTAHVGVVLGALLGLLGLMLGFTFAGASGRYIERQRLIVVEANALGTAWLRADLLEADGRAAVRAALKDYAAHRVALAETAEHDEVARMDAALDADCARLWDAAVAGSRNVSASALLLLPSVNEVIDLQGERKAVARLQLPTAVVALLVVAAAVTVFAIGFAEGLMGTRHRIFAVSLAALIACAIWLTIDLDHPREGLMQVDASALVEVRDSMK